MTPSLATARAMACPGCGHYRWIVTEYWPETLTDPACGTGRCGCAGVRPCACDGDCDCEERCGCDYEGEF
jgi:hypothetical protein